MGSQVDFSLTWQAFRLALALARFSGFEPVSMLLRGVHRSLRRSWARRTAFSGVVRVKNSLQLPGGESNYTVLDLATQRQEVLTWYSCGPTVYDAAHIGHARAYVCTDIIRRILTDVFGVRVNYAMGVTDIDDKIIARATEELKSRVAGTQKSVPRLDWASLVAFARRHEEDFFSDMALLGVRPPDATLRVTEHMPEIIAFVEALLLRGNAYRLKDGIYFDVEASCESAYGKLGGNIPRGDEEEVEAGVGDGGGPKNQKRSPRDFALWKLTRPHEPGHEGGSLGIGRPGWHIECSAMTHSYFGPWLDVHSGGVDLKFPHHTNEIAQSEAFASHLAVEDRKREGANAERERSEWVRLWIHTGHIYIKGRKMSKSLKNFITVKEYLAGGYSPCPATDFRIFCLQHRYLSTLHFSKERIDEASMLRVKFENFHRLVNLLLSSSFSASSSSGASAAATDLASAKPSSESRALKAALLETEDAVLRHLADDFDTPSALRALSELVGKGTNHANALTTWMAGGKEGLVAVDSFVRRSLALLGLPELVPSSLRGLTQAPFSLSSSSGQDASSSAAAACAGGSGGAGAGAAGNKISDALVDELVRLRSSVRAVGLDGLKAMKPSKRRNASTSSASSSSSSPSSAADMAGRAGAEAGAEAEAEATREQQGQRQEAFQRILRACDETRDRARDLGIVIDDAGSGSTWRRGSR